MTGSGKMLFLEDDCYRHVRKVRFGQNYTFGHIFAVSDFSCVAAVVTVAGALNNATPIQILPASYTDGTQVVAVTSDAGVTLAQASAYFTVKPNDGAYPSTCTVTFDGQVN